MRKYRQWLMRRRVKRAVELLIKVDAAMIKMKMPRQIRKQIWRDFVKSPARRLDILSVFDGGKR